MLNKRQLIIFRDEVGEVRAEDLKAQINKMWITINQFYWNSSKEKKYLFYMEKCSQCHSFFIFTIHIRVTKSMWAFLFPFPKWMEYVMCNLAPQNSLNLYFPKQVNNLFQNSVSTLNLMDITDMYKTFHPKYNKTTTTKE